jgi:hypothetical protein
VTWAGEIVFVAKTKFSVWYPYGPWFAGIAAEGVLLAVSGLSRAQSVIDTGTLVVRLLRFSILLLLPFLYFTRRYNRAEDEDDDRQPLISPGMAVDTQAMNSDTASIESLDSIIEDEQTGKDLMKARLQNGNWWAYIRGFAVSFPAVRAMGFTLIAVAGFSSIYLAIK